MTSRIQLTQQPAGKAQVLLDGHDITYSLTSVDIHATGRPYTTEVTLHLKGGLVEADLYTDNIKVKSADA